MEKAESPAVFKFHRVTKSSHPDKPCAVKDCERAGIAGVANHNHWQRICNESCDGFVTLDDMLAKRNLRDRPGQPLGDFSYLPHLDAGRNAISPTVPVPLRIPDRLARLPDLPPWV